MKRQNNTVRFPDNLLVYLRREADLTQEQLASEADISPRSVIRAEQTNSTSTDTATKIGAALTQITGHTVILDDAQTTQALHNKLCKKYELPFSPELERLHQRSKFTLAEAGQISDQRGTIQLDELYTTRECETEILNTVRRTSGILFIVGSAGSGKTSMLWRLASRLMDEGKIVFFFRAASVTSKEGASDFAHLPAVSSNHGGQVVIIDTVDAVLNDATARERLNTAIENALEKGYRIVAASRPTEKNRYFPNSNHVNVPPSYSQAEFERVVESHVRSFYKISDIEEVAIRIGEISSIVTSGSVVTEIAYQPLTLRMLFTVYAPHKIPSDINSISLYNEYWDKRVRSDWRAGNLEPEAGASDLSECGEVIAERMLVDGRIQLPVVEIIEELISRNAQASALDELVTRGVLQRVSINAEQDGIEFFHQTFFEFASSRTVLKRDVLIDLEQLYTHLIENPFDNFRIPVIENALAQSIYSIEQIQGTASQIIGKILAEKTEHLINGALRALSLSARLLDRHREALHTMLADRSRAAQLVRLSPSAPLAILAELWQLFMELWIVEENANFDRSPRSVRTAILDEMHRLVGRDPMLCDPILTFVESRQIHTEISEQDISRILQFFAEAAKVHPERSISLMFETYKNLFSDSRKRHNSLARAAFAISQTKNIPSEMLHQTSMELDAVDDNRVRRVQCEIQAILWAKDDDPPYLNIKETDLENPNFVGLLRSWSRNKQETVWVELWSAFVELATRYPDNNTFFTLWVRDLWQQLDKNPIETLESMSHRGFDFLTYRLGKALKSKDDALRLVAERVCRYIRSNAVLIEVFGGLQDDAFDGFLTKDAQSIFFVIEILATGEFPVDGDRSQEFFARKVVRKKFIDSAEEIFLVHPHLADQVAAHLIQLDEFQRFELSLQKGLVRLSPLTPQCAAQLGKQIMGALESEKISNRQLGARMAYLVLQCALNVPLLFTQIENAAGKEADPRTYAWLSMTLLALASEEPEIKTAYPKLVEVVAKGDQYVRERAFAALCRCIVEKRISIDVDELIEAIESYINAGKIVQAIRFAAELHASDPKSANSLALAILFGEFTNSLGRTPLASFRIRARIPLSVWIGRLQEDELESVLSQLNDLDPEIGLMIVDATLNPPHLAKATAVLSSFVQENLENGRFNQGIANLIRLRNADMGVMRVKPVA